MHRPLEMDSTVFDVVTSVEQAAEIAGEWNELHRSCGFPLFCGYDWFRLWWDTIGKKKWRPHVITARQGGRLVGVLPLAVRRHCGLRLLEWAGNDIFDYCRPLLADARLAHALWNRVPEAGGYDLMSIKDVRKDSPCFAILRTAAAAWPGGETAHINLSGLTEEKWWASLSAKTRRGTQKKLRDLEKQVPVKFDAVLSEDGCQASVESLITLALAWRTKKNIWGIFAPEDIGTITRGLVALASRHGQLFFGTLTCGDEPAAHVFGFLHQGVLYGHTTAFDEKWSEFSPGTLVMAKSVIWAIENGLHTYDFMRGDEAYKQRFANGSSPLFHFLRPRSVVGKIVYGGLIAALYVFALIKKTPPEMFSPYACLPLKRPAAAAGKRAQAASA